MYETLKKVLTVVVITTKEKKSTAARNWPFQQRCTIQWPKHNTHHNNTYRVKKFCWFFDFFFAPVLFFSIGCGYIYLKKKQQVLKREQFGRTNSVDVWKLSRNHRTVTFFFISSKFFFVFFFALRLHQNSIFLFWSVFVFFLKRSGGQYVYRSDSTWARQSC